MFAARPRGFLKHECSVSSFPLCTITDWNKKGKLCIDKMYIMIYICIYKSGGNVPARPRFLNIVILFFLLMEVFKMNIDEIDIYDYFQKGFENDLKRVEEA